MQSFSREQIDLIATRSRALGDATRVRIFLALRRGEQSVGQIAEAAGTQQSAASKHLQVLFHAGLVHRQRAAATVMYRLAAPDLLKWLRYLARRRVGKTTNRRSGSVRAVKGAVTSHSRA